MSVADPPGPNAFSIEPVRSAVSAASPSTLKSSVTVGRADGSASHERSPSTRSSPVPVGTSEPVSPSSIARAIVDLPDSFGPRMIVSPGARSIWRSR